MMADPLYNVGSRVCLRAFPARKGRVVEIRSYSAGYQYLTLMGDEENWVAEADLEAIASHKYRWQTRDAFLRDLMIAKMRYPLADNLYAYRASRTKFEAYQFRPALKFLRQPDQRILIADEVGLGKTIEAAIIYLELKARTDISRVLVLCPARLKAKWISELRNRFDEEFQDLGVDGLRRIFEDHDRFGQVTFRAVASYETLRRDEIVQAFSERQIPIDLLIADEAHYMRNSGTATYRLGTALTDLADAVIFLTATPLHLGNENLFHLMHLLLPGEYEDSRWFEQQIQPNAFINRAVQHLAARDHGAALKELRKVETATLHDRFLKNPYYHEVVTALQQPAGDRAARVHLQRDLIELNTLSTVFTRTLKREVVGGAVRAPVSINVELTPQEMEFYQGIVRHVRLQLRQSGSAVHSFAIISRERMAASCLAAMRELFEETARAGRPSGANMETPLFESDDIDDDLLAESTDELRRLSRSIGKHDSKFEMFKQTLDQALAEGDGSKALVFSFFRRTLSYLHRRLVEAGYTVEVIHGGVSLIDRQEIIERFRTDPGLRVLLSSEVGAEGLDFQFCDVLVNYDLPWNPMQVEQRIGRLDRFGQTHPRIRIYNFFLEDTIESRIFQRLYERINIFKSSIGDLEDILGEQIRSLSKAVLQTSLTPEQEVQLGERAADQIIQRQRANEELEAKKDELLGQEALFSEQVNETVASGRVVHAEEIRALVQSFLNHCFTNVEFTRDDEEPTYTLTFTPAISAYLNEYTRKHPSRRYTTGLRFKEGMARNKQVALTFDADLARERQLLEFVTHQHLLAVAAIDYWAEILTDGAVPAARLMIDGQNDEVGDGYFFIYALDEHGMTSKRTLYPVIVLEDGSLAPRTATTLLSQIHRYTKAWDAPEDDPQQMERCERIANGWMAEQRDHISVQSNKRHTALVAIRESSITESFGAKIRRAQQALESVGDPRIRRLHEGQIRNLKAQRTQKLESLHKSKNVTVSHTLIATGRVRLIPVIQTNVPESFSSDELVLVPEEMVVQAPVQEDVGVHEYVYEARQPADTATHDGLKAINRIFSRLFRSHKRDDSN